MSILSAFVVFDILIIGYELIIEVFSAIYELSGLTKEQARFQVTSLLTGTGFTTSESEKMLDTQKRKTVTRDIMIVSYIFNISIISTLVTLLTSTQNSNWYELVIGFILSIVIIILLFFSRKVNKIRKGIDRIMLYIAEHTFYRNQNQILIYEYYGNKVLTEIKLNKITDKLKDKTIEEIEIENNINILYLKRNSKCITNKKNMKLNIKDILLIIGNKNKIYKLFK